jgi:hypothetical protein
MIRLLPTSSSQTFSILPRTLDTTGINATIREDGTGNIVTISDVTASVNNDYIDITLSSDKFIAERAYVLEMTRGANLWYRDKIYVTSQTDTDIYHTISTDYYEENDTDGDDKYITI